jgi:hypothetical protein
MWLWLPEERDSNSWGLETNTEDVNSWIGWYDSFLERSFHYGETILLTNARKVTSSIAVILFASSLF